MPLPWSNLKAWRACLVHTDPGNSSRSAPCAKQLAAAAPCAYCTARWEPLQAGTDQHLSVSGYDTGEDYHQVRKR